MLRPELDEIRKKEDAIKTWVFEFLDKMSVDLNKMRFERNDFIASHIKFSTGQFEDVKNITICHFIVQWKYKNGIK